MNFFYKNFAAGHSVMKNHVCALRKPAEKGDFDMLRGQAWYKRLKDSFKSTILITTISPRSHLFYRTNTAILHQREKHLRSDYARIIHPFSTFRIKWEIFMMIVFLIYLLVVPIIVAFIQSNESDGYMLAVAYVGGGLDFICIADIIMTFFTGYAIEHTKQVILIPRVIITHYVLSIYFILDVVSSMPTEFIVLIITRIRRTSYQIIKYVHLAGLLKVIRIRTLMIYMSRAAQLWHINELFLNTFKYCFIAFLLIHWCGCVQYIVPVYWYGYNNLPNASWIVLRNATSQFSVYNRYIECLFKASTQLFCVSNKIYKPETIDDIVMDIIVGFLGYILTGIALVMFIQFLFRLHTSEIKYHSIMNQLKEYMRHKQLPLPMQKRLIDYYDYRFKKSYFRENTIFPTISERLRKDINTYICMNLVKKVPILKDLPSSVIGNIVPCLRQEVFLPNDIIVKAGTIGDSMYFIHCGTVAVYTPTGKEVCHLQDGAYFGEMGLIAKDCKRIANVVAIETTEVYRLDRKHFNSYLKSLPDLYKKLERVADRRRENTLVMEEIHRKHILEKTMRMMDDRS